MDAWQDADIFVKILTRPIPQLSISILIMPVYRWTFQCLVLSSYNLNCVVVKGSPVQSYVDHSLLACDTVARLGGEIQGQKKGWGCVTSVNQSMHCCFLSELEIMRAKDRLWSLNAIKFSVVGYHSFLLGFSLSLIIFSFSFFSPLLSWLI